jgi:hypothetical protein
MAAPKGDIYTRIADVVPPDGPVLSPKNRFLDGWWRWLWVFRKTADDNFTSVAVNDLGAQQAGQIEALQAEITALRLQFGSFQAEAVQDLAAVTAQQAQTQEMVGAIEQIIAPDGLQASVQQAIDLALANGAYVTLPPPPAQDSATIASAGEEFGARLTALEAYLPELMPRSEPPAADLSTQPWIETGHLAVRDKMERFATVTVMNDITGAGGLLANWGVFTGSALGGGPILWAATGAGDANVGMTILPKGTGAIMAAIPDGTAVGGNARGAGAVDLQMNRASNTSVASGANSTTFGSNNGASGQASVAMGQNSVASGLAAFAMGNSSTAGGQSSVALGGTCTDRGVSGCFVFGSNRFTVNGDAQKLECIHMSTTAAAAAVRLTTNGSAVSAVAGSINILILPANSTYLIRIDMAVQDNTAGTSWVFTLAAASIHRGATAASTVTGTGNPVFVAGPTTGAAAVIATVPTFTADTTNGAINITFTPPVGNTNTLHITGTTYVQQVA